MKNTLAENMLRFGSKNLDAKSINRLKNLAEQSAPRETVNVTLLPAAMNSKVPTLLESANAAIVFPPTGMNSPGDVAVRSGMGYIVSLTSTYYLVIGNLGVLDANMAVTKEMTTGKIFAMKPFRSTENPSVGNPVRLISTINLANIPMAIATIVKSINSNPDRGSTYASIKSNLISIFNLSKDFGVDTTLMTKPNFDQLVNTALVS